MRALRGPLVVMGDLHFPYTDKAAVAVALQVIASISPAAIVLNGDILDCYQISRFSQDPLRKTQLQADIDGCRRCLEEVRDAAPEADIYYTEGNHEERLTHFKWANPEASSLSALTIPALLDLKSLSVQWIGARERLEFGDWVVTHGAMCRSKAGATAQGMIDRYGCSGVSNHVHRLAQVSRRTYARELTWIENGCLCALDMEYLDLPDWLHGFSVLHADGSQVYPELVNIKNGRTLYRGVVYSA